jgi:hypothetical protein
MISMNRLCASDLSPIASSYLTRSRYTRAFIALMWLGYSAFCTPKRVSLSLDMVKNLTKYDLYASEQDLTPMSTMYIFPMFVITMCYSQNVLTLDDSQMLLNGTTQQLTIQYALRLSLSKFN